MIQSEYISSDYSRTTLPGKRGFHLKHGEFVSIIGLLAAAMATLL